MGVSFYLKNKNAENETMIMLTFTYNGRRLRYSTKVKVKPKNWNFKQQNIYSSGKITSEKNAKLKEYKRALELEYDRNIKEGVIPTIDYLKEFLDSKFKAKHKYSGTDFFQFYDEFIAAKKKELNDHSNSLRSYYAMRKHLIAIEKYYKIRLEIYSFTEKFYKKFIDYFVVLNRENSTIKENYLKAIKTFLNWLVAEGYIEANLFANIKFPYKLSPSNSVALTESELKKFFTIDLSDNPRLERLRDIFCLECYTGLRYSDAKKVKKHHWQGRFLTIFTEKTTQQLKIPLRAEAFAILDKYLGNDLPLPVISNQKMNKYLKELGKLCELNTPVSVLKISGTKKREYTYPKYQRLGTHTGRRTFVTLAYQKGMRPFDIMKITGHTKFDTFKKYYRLDEIEVYDNFFELHDGLASEYSISEIITKLLKKGVSTDTIAFAFGIEKKEIEHLVKNI